MFKQCGKLWRSWEAFSHTTIYPNHHTDWQHPGSNHTSGRCLYFPRVCLNVLQQPCRSFVHEAFYLWWVDRCTLAQKAQNTLYRSRERSNYCSKYHFMINFSRSSSCRHGGSIMGALKSWQRAQELLQQKKKKKRRKKWASSHKKTGEFRSNLQLISLPTHAVKHCSCCPDCKIVLSQAVHWSWPSWSPR